MASGSGTSSQPQSAQVEILEVSTVVPARRRSDTEDTTHHQKKKVDLSALDLFWREIHYNLRLVFFDITTDAINEDEEEGEGEGERVAVAAVERLKGGLREVLADFYPLAGRLARDDECAGRFFIECEDQGVEFVVASVDASFASLRDSSFAFQPYFPHLARLGHLTRSDAPDLPLLSVQVTKFLGGRIAIGVSHNHVVLDGNSLWHFMVSWGERTRGVELSKPPIHMRPTILMPKKVSQELAKDVSFELVRFEMKPEEEKLMAGIGSKDQVDKVFHFSNEVMGRLKGWALEAREEIDGPTREASGLEALFAHVWRRVIAARRVSRQSQVSFVVLADWRRRRRGMEGPPPVPRNFVGNALTWTYTATSARTLLEESFAATLARVVAEVDHCTSLDTLLGTLHWLELHDTHFQLDACGFPGITMNVASSPRFPVYDVDFGWGPPVAARPTRMVAVGEICLFPGHPNSGGGVDLCIRLEPASLHALSHDPLFIP